MHISKWLEIHEELTKKYKQQLKKYPAVSSGRDVATAHYLAACSELRRTPVSYRGASTESTATQIKVDTTGLEGQDYRNFL